MSADTVSCILHHTYRCPRYDITKYEPTWIAHLPLSALEVRTCICNELSLSTFFIDEMIDCPVSSITEGETNVTCAAKTKI